MSGDYTDEIEMARQMIEESGGPVTLRVFTPEEDPTKPWRAGESDYDDIEDLAGVFLSYDVKHIDGTLIQAGDQKILLAAGGLTLAPNLNGQAIRGSEVWKIVKIRQLNPAGQAILYTIQVRQ